MVFSPSGFDKTNLDPEQVCVVIRHSGLKPQKCTIKERSFICELEPTTTTTTEAPLSETTATDERYPGTCTSL